MNLSASCQDLLESFRKVSAWFSGRIKYLIFLRIQTGIALFTFLLFNTAQTREILRSNLEDGRYLKMACVILLTFLLSICIWHTSRALSLSRKRNDRFHAKPAGRAAWLPRILGVSPMAALAWQIYQIPKSEITTNLRALFFDINLWLASLITVVSMLCVLLIFFNIRQRLPFISSYEAGQGIFSKGMEVFLFFAAWGIFAFFAIPNSISLSENDANSGVVAVIVLMIILVLVHWSLLCWANPRHHTYIWVGLLVALLFIILSAGKKGKSLLFWPQYIGSLSMLLLAMLSALVVFSTIYRWSIHEKVPIITPLLIATLTMNIFGCNENRSVRTLPSAEEGRTSQSVEQSPASEYFEKWFNERDERWKKKRNCDYSQRCPIFIVAAQGGGIYAAYHAGRVMSVLNEETEGGFAEHLFAISGVSGGSVGSASFLAINNISRYSHKLKTKLVSQHLKSDLLSPLLAVALFGDSLQGMLPFPISVWDRSLGLEIALESGFQNVSYKNIKDNEVSSKDQIDGISHEIETFMETPLNGPRTHSPALVVNTTIAEDGQRFLIAPFAINAEELPGISSGSEDLIRYSTAAVLSARFPFITSHGTITERNAIDTGRPKKVRLVDGGYFDNSGLVTALQLRDLLRRKQSDQQRASYPIVVIALTDLNEATQSIINKKSSGDKNNTTYNASNTKSRGVLSLPPLSPLSALWMTRESRTKQIFINAFMSKEMGDKDEIIVLPLLKRIDTKVSLPLGWKLSNKRAAFIDLQTPSTNLITQLTPGPAA